MAEPGTTYITEKTYRLTKDLFRFESLGKKTVKGKKEEISVYKVLSVKEDVYRARLGSERMIYSEMVGRYKELHRLELQVMKAINGEGSVINIIGEAGIGKSRLIAELKKREIMKEVPFFEGRAISIGRNLNFHPIIDLLKQWAQIKENDGEAMAFGKLEAAVRGLYPEKSGEVLPFVATLMGMKPSGRYAERIEGIEGEALEKLILKNLRDLLAKAAELTPLVIVLEDMHWIDTSSIELMESIFRLAETKRILFINVFRPGNKDTGERIVETVKERLPVYYVEIMLEPLDERMSEALISNMLNIGEHHPVAGQIVQRAGGNPYFIEEVVRSLIDERAVVLRHGTFHATEKIGTIIIPNTINDVLMSRIDRLDEDTRKLLKMASVIGRNFFYRILSKVAGQIQEIDSRLSYLREIQILRKRERKGEVEYLFKHGLAQEAAYESILPQKRKELHLKVASSIEQVFCERLHEFYGMLAYHYSKAENLEKTEVFMIKAGEEALKSSASNEALNYYQEALSLYQKKYGDVADPEKVAMLEKNIALALYNKGRFEEAIRYFDNTLEYYWGPLPKNAVSALLKVLYASLHLLIFLYLPSLKHKRIPTQKDAEIVELLYKKCLSLSIKDPKRYFFELMYAYKEVSKFDLTRFDLGLEIFLGVSGLFTFSGISFKLSRKILDSAKHKVQENDPKRSIVYEYLELILYSLEGNWKKIGDWVDDLANKNLRIGEIFSAVQYLYWYGLLNIYRGSSDVAKSMVKELNEIVEVYDNDFAQILKYELNTTLLMEYRRLKDALIEVKLGIDFAQKAGLGIFLLDLLSYEVWIHILMGNIEKAGESLQRANEIKPKEHAAPVELLCLCRSQLEYDLYRLEEAIRNGNQLESIGFKKNVAKSSRMLLKVARKGAPHRTESYKLRGVYYWLINKQKKALKWWHKAIEEGERLGARVELSRAYFEIGKRLLEPKSNYGMLDGIKADDYLQRARVLFEEMDLQWDLNEFSRVSRD